MTGLTEQSCVPCRGGVPPLAEDDAQKYLTQTPGWELREGKRIERTYKFKNFREALGFVDGVGGLTEVSRAPTTRAVPATVRSTHAPPRTQMARIRTQMRHPCRMDLDIN